MSISRVRIASQLALGRMGVKRGKRACVAFLLRTSELPGAHWIPIATVTVRAGTVGVRDEISDRARDRRLLSSGRQFEFRRPNREATRQLRN